ncbi:hypothetical protein EON82_18305, partial [bacterium]
MPRKKLTSEVIPPSDITPPASAEKRPRSRSRKAAEEVVPTPEAVTEPVAAEKPKRGRAAKAVEVPIVTEPEKPKRGRKAKAPEPAIEAPAPKRGGRKPKAVEETVTEAPVAPEGIDLGDGRFLAVAFRPRAGAKPAPAVKPSAPVGEPMPEAPAAVVFVPLDGEEPLPAVTFRSRTTGDAKPTKRKVLEAAPVVVEMPASFDISEDEMPIINWRPRGTGAPTVEEEETSGSLEEEGRDRSRRRRRG